MFRDALADVRDIANDTADWLLQYTGRGSRSALVLRCPQEPEVNAIYPLALVDGRVVEVMTLEVYNASSSRYAQVMCPELQEPIMVEVVVEGRAEILRGTPEAVTSTAAPSVVALRDLDLRGAVLGL